MGELKPNRIDRMAEFVADFSLAGMRALVQNRRDATESWVLLQPGKYVSRRAWRSFHNFGFRGIDSYMPVADLSSLKIDDAHRSGGSGGKFWRIFAASLGVLVLLIGGVFALRSRQPVVEVAAARPANSQEAETLLNASGYVTPRRRATVAAKITGRVTGVLL